MILKVVEVKTIPLPLERLCHENDGVHLTAT
jgi:hypothetical protein